MRLIFCFVICLVIVHLALANKKGSRKHRSPMDDVAARNDDSNESSSIEDASSRSKSKSILKNSKKVKEKKVSFKENDESNEDDDEETDNPKTCKRKSSSQHNTCSSSCCNSCCYPCASPCSANSCNSAVPNNNQEKSAQNPHKDEDKQKTPKQDKPKPLEDKSKSRNFDDDKSKRLPSSCAEALAQDNGHSGLRRIEIPDSGLKPFYIYCRRDPNGGDAWEIVQRRQDGSINFYRNWTDYKQGFGNIMGEFFIGLDKLHAITASSPHELWIELRDFEGENRNATYSSFAIGDESEGYAIQVLGPFSGGAGDSLTKHAGNKFTTQDVDNDSSEEKNCAKTHTGAWWYYSCFRSHLNGVYQTANNATEVYGKGVHWVSWHGNKYSLKYVHMALRPTKPK